ncbi:MAG: hypothetical protein K2H96_03485 [Muribaculaceae bacterium]|nr:hypothetical protein [Muribaculaceae bacterium]
MKIIVTFLLAVLPIIANAQQLIHFTWNETGTTQSGYSPGITIHEGEAYQLKFTTSPECDNVFEDTFNWVYYHYLPESGGWIVEDDIQIFTISPGGVVKGCCSGLGAIKGTGYVQGAKERFYIEVVPAEEIEPNDKPEDAVELGSTALPFSLSSTLDIDWFKVFAKVGDNVIVKVCSQESLTQPYQFRVETYDSNMQIINAYNETIDNEIPYFESEVRTITSSGWYYVKISFNTPNVSDILYYNGEMTIQAFVNGEPISGINNMEIPEPEYQFFNLQGLKVDPQKTKGQILIKTNGIKSEKVFNK